MDRARRGVRACAPRRGGGACPGFRGRRGAARQPRQRYQHHHLCRAYHDCAAGFGTGPPPHPGAGLLLGRLHDGRRPWRPWTSLTGPSTRPGARDARRRPTRRQCERMLPVVAAQGARAARPSIGLFRAATLGARETEPTFGGRPSPRGSGQAAEQLDPSGRRASGTHSTLRPRLCVAGPSDAEAGDPVSAGNGWREASP